MPVRSPIRLRCHANAFGDRNAICAWKCEGDVRAAKFIDRRAPDRYAIIHRSSKKAGWWQLSRFDAEGAVGDSLRPTCDAALKDGLDNGSRWRLAKKGE